jgi:hypothetical protein
MEKRHPVNHSCVRSGSCVKYSFQMMDVSDVCMMLGWRVKRKALRDEMVFQSAQVERDTT